MIVAFLATICDFFQISFHSAKKLFKDYLPLVVIGAVEVTYNNYQS
jgi:hypothetical protein